MKKALRALVFFSTIEIAVYLLAATAAWAIADHDLAALDRSFYTDVRVRPHAMIMAGVQGVIVFFNTYAFFWLLRQGGKTAAYLGLPIAGALISLFFLPTMFSVYGLGGIIGLFVAVKLLAQLWKVLSWPFRKMFGRKKAEASPAPAPPKSAAPSKKAG